MGAVTLTPCLFWQVDKSIVDEMENNPGMNEPDAVNRVRSSLTAEFKEQVGSQRHFLVSARDMFKGTSRMDEEAFKAFLSDFARRRLADKDEARAIG